MCVCSVCSVCGATSADMLDMFDIFECFSAVVFVFSIAESMLDRLDEYFVVINHSITALLHIDVPAADQHKIWFNFWGNSGESFHASGELKSFSKSLKR